MESAGLRRRNSAPSASSLPAATSTSTMTIKKSSSKLSSKSTPVTALLNDSNDPDHLVPPRFTVDLSLPPRDRYQHITPHFLPIMTDPSISLPNIYTNLICGLTRYRVVQKALLLLSRLILTRMCSKEETEEIRGISRDTGVPMYLLVALNVLLDLLLGCTSGGIRVVDGEEGPDQCRMMHFRTLDWGMDELRPLTVELDFVRGQGTRVIATTITYFGYVGVLTGVRKGLSASLNFRPHHDGSTVRKEVAFRVHQALVLLGWRKGVSSLLREVLLRPDAQLDGEEDGVGEKPEVVIERSRWQVFCGMVNPWHKIPAPRPNVMTYVISHLRSEPSAAAYLILCTPQVAYTIEKDHRHGSIFSSNDYLATFNHDRSDEADPASLQAVAHDVAETAAGMEMIVSCSITRKEILDDKRVRALNRQAKRTRKAVGMNTGVSLKDVIWMVMDRDVSNDETHFSCIMDPKEGKVVWRRRFEAIPWE